MTATRRRRNHRRALIAVVAAAAMAMASGQALAGLGLGRSGAVGDEPVVAAAAASGGVSAPAVPVPTAAVPTTAAVPARPAASPPAVPGPADRAATNAFGLTSRGEFVVDPAAALVVVPGAFPAVPDDPAGRYTFGMRPTGGGQFEPVLHGRRCLRPEVASAVQNIGLRFWALFGGDGLGLVVGEGNSDGNHATHFGGGYVDLYTSLANRHTERFVEREGGPHPHVAGLPFVAGYLRRGGRLTYEESIGLWLAMSLVDSRQFRRMVFEFDTVNQLAEAYAAQGAVPFDADAIRSTGNRTHTYHLHVESSTDGTSRTCDR